MFREHLISGLFRPKPAGKEGGSWLRNRAELWAFPGRDSNGRAGDVFGVRNRSDRHGGLARFPVQ